MKILLTHGYFLKEDSNEQRIMMPYPPLGILYISAYLDKHNIDNEIFDTTFLSKKELKEKLLNYKPGFLGLYVNLMTKINVLEIINFVKSEPVLSRTKIILGGPDVRYNAENFLASGADFLVIGEGEQSMLELVQTLQQSKFENLKNIAGIGFSGDNDKICINVERPLIQSIDELPFPSRKKIDLKKYQEAWKKRHGYSAISVSTMRGCPYTCRWCSRAVYGLTYRRRSADKVVEELEWINEEYNPDTIWFVDDVFTINYKWMNEFQSALRNKKLIIKYECITRADRMNKEIISILKNTGCFRVWIGAESGSQKVIDLMDRKVKVEQVREMILLSKKYGIEAGTFIMLGYPGETEKDIEETITHLKKSNPDHFTITVAYPIKGTEFYQEVEATQLKSFDWKSGTDREREFKRTYNRIYYEFVVRRVVNEVNFFKKKAINAHLSLQGINFKSKSVLAKAGMLLTKYI